MDGSRDDNEVNWRDIATEALGPLGGQVERLAASLADGIRRRDGDDARDRQYVLEDAFSLLARLRLALNPLYANSGLSVADQTRLKHLTTNRQQWAEPQNVIWAYPPAPMNVGADTWHSWPISRFDLLEASEEYIQVFLGTCYELERILISALSYAEAAAYQDSVLTQANGVVASALAAGRPSRLLWMRAVNGLARSAWRLLLAAIIGVIAGDRYGSEAGFLVAIGFYLLASLRRDQLAIHEAGTRDRTMRLAGSMVAVATATSTGALVPAQLVYQLEQTTADGAVWPTPLWRLALAIRERCSWDHRIELRRA